MAQESVKFDFVAFDQIPRLVDEHPLVHRALDGGIHRPQFFSRLADNPDIFDDFPCYFYGAENGEIVSSVALLPDRLSAGGNVYRWGWTGGLMTSPSHRGRGLGTGIVEYVAKTLAERELATGGAFTDELRLFTRAKHVIPGFGSRYVYVRSARPILKYHLKSRCLASIGNALLEPARCAYYAFRSPESPARLGLEVERVSPEDLASSRVGFGDLAYDCPLHFNDTPEKIAWKMHGKPSLSTYLVREQSTGNRVAFYVLNDRQVEAPTYLGRYGGFRLVTMMDFGAFDSAPAVYRKLMNVVLYRFREEGGDIFELISTSPSLNAAARKLGLLKVGKGMTFHYTAPPSCALPDTAGDISNWHLTHFSSDGFSFS